MISAHRIPNHDVFICYYGDVELRKLRVSMPCYRARRLSRDPNFEELFREEFDPDTLDAISKHFRFTIERELVRA